MRVDIAGRDVTRYLRYCKFNKLSFCVDTIILLDCHCIWYHSNLQFLILYVARFLLRKEGINFRTSSEFEIVRTIKERECFLSTNPSKDESSESDRRIYKLPDGSQLDVINLWFVLIWFTSRTNNGAIFLIIKFIGTLQIGPARFRAPEVLFRPDLIGEECESMHEVLLFAIQKSDTDLRKILFQNIVLSGGSTLFKVCITSFSYQKIFNGCLENLKTKLHEIVGVWWQTIVWSEKTCTERH